MTNAVGGTTGRLAYDPNVPAFPPPPNVSNHDFDRNDSLQVPSSRHRHRSQPPVSSAGQSELSRRGSDRSDRSPSPERSRDDSQSPLGKVKHAADKTFSTSKSGIGVGVLGAIVGGFAAHEASEAASRARDKRDGRDHHHHGSRDHQRAALISTIVGAAVGGLGANAIEKRIEHRRHDRDHDDRDREHKPRELEYGGGSGSRGISDRGHSRGHSSRGGEDSDDDWESGGSGGGRSRGRHNNHERNLVISRSPSASLSRSRSNSRNRAQRPQHGGAADSYYNSARSHDGRSDRRG